MVRPDSPQDPEYRKGSKKLMDAMLDSYNDEKAKNPNATWGGGGGSNDKSCGKAASMMLLMVIMAGVISSMVVHQLV